MSLITLLLQNLGIKLFITYTYFSMQHVDVVARSLGWIKVREEGFSCMAPKTRDL